MLRQLLAAAALAGAFDTAHAGSVLETAQHAAEVPLHALQLPAAAGGLVRFAACVGCQIHTATMPGSTRYVINNRPATFEAFAAAVDTARTTSETANRSLVGLYFDAASKRLARIALVTPLPR